MEKGGDRQKENQQRKKEKEQEVIEIISKSVKMKNH